MNKKNQIREKLSVCFPVKSMKEMEEIFNWIKTHNDVYSSRFGSNDFYTSGFNGFIGSRDMTKEEIEKNKKEEKIKKIKEQAKKEKADKERINKLQKEAEELGFVLTRVNDR